MSSETQPSHDGHVTEFLPQTCHACALEEVESLRQRLQRAEDLLERWLKVSLIIWKPLEQDTKAWLAGVASQTEEVK